VQNGLLVLEDEQGRRLAVVGYYGDDRLWAWKTLTGSGERCRCQEDAVRKAEESLA
jgi:hypothetical protein